MTRILFPYNDQPICFPYYVEGLAQALEFGAKGITFYLVENNNKLRYLDPFMFGTIDSITFDTMDSLSLGI